MNLNSSLWTIKKTQQWIKQAVEYYVCYACQVLSHAAISNGLICP